MKFVFEILNMFLYEISNIFASPAVYFEQGKFDECIKECESAIEVGRENRADFKLIAK